MKGSDFDATCDNIKGIVISLIKSARLTLARQKLRFLKHKLSSTLTP